MLNDEIIIDKYKQGASGIEISEQDGRSPRTIQRIISYYGITRSRKDTFNNAIKRGRMTYIKKPKELLKNRVTIPLKTRYKILTKYNSTCCLCGNTAKESRIQIDHIDNNPSNNNEDNLQVVCEPCNKGKAYNS